MTRKNKYAVNIFSGRLDKVIDQVGETQVLSGVNIDFTNSDLLSKTIAEDTVFTVSNPELWKDVILILTGDFAITLPASFTKIDGSKDYDGTVNNYILITCIK